MSKTIEKIWTGELCPMEHFGLNNEKFIRAERKMYNSMEELEAILKADQKKIFDKYIEYYNHYNSEAINEAFSIGFSMGMKIATEALNCAEKL